MRFVLLLDKTVLFACSEPITGSTPGVTSWPNTITLPSAPESFVAFFNGGSAQDITGYWNKNQNIGYAIRTNEGIGNVTVSGNVVSINVTPVGGTVHYTYL